MHKFIKLDATLVAALAKALAESSSNPASPSEAAEPRWIRAPLQKQGPCHYTGLQHASFYLAFANNPRIRQARMGAGRERGTRLFWLPDVYAEIQRISDQQKEELS